MLKINPRAPHFLKLECSGIHMYLRLVVIFFRIFLISCEAGALNGPTSMRNNSGLSTIIDFFVIVAFEGLKSISHCSWKILGLEEGMSFCNVSTRDGKPFDNSHKVFAGRGLPWTGWETQVWISVEVHATTIPVHIKPFSIQ